jgi:hypothetical protein
MSECVRSSLGWGWSNLSALFRADRWSWFVCTAPELNTKSHPTVPCPPAGPAEMSTDQTANLRFDLNRQICRFSHLQQLHMAKMTSRQLALSGYRQDSEHVWMLNPPRARINEPEEGGGGQISRRFSPRTGLIHKQNLRSFKNRKPTSGVRTLQDGLCAST